MPVEFVGSHVGTHASTSRQTVAFSNLRDASNAQPTLQEGDLVILAVENALTTSNSTNLMGYNSFYNAFYTDAHSANYQNDSNDSNFLVSYRFMGPTPDTDISIPPSGATTGGLAYAIYVFRGVSGFDVTPVVTGGTNTGVANAPAITPVTAGAWIVAFGGAAVASGVAFTNPTGMSTTTNHFRSATITTTTNDANIGGAIFTGWTSGAYDPPAFGGSTTTNTGSWSAVTLALRPGAFPRTMTPTAAQLFTNFFTNASWNSPQNFWGVTVSTNVAANPVNGLTTAQLVTESAANQLHYVQTGASNISFSRAVPSRVQAYVKPNGRTKIQLLAKTTTSVSGQVTAIFDLSAKTVGTPSASGTLSHFASGIEELSNGWLRCWLDVNVGSEGARGQGELYLVDGSNQTLYTGDGTSGIYLYAATLTTGALIILKPYVSFVYRGARVRTTVYYGSRTDAQLYLGQRQLFP